MSQKMQAASAMTDTLRTGRELPEDDLFDLEGVRRDIAESRFRALKVGAVVCHVEMVDGEEMIIRERADVLALHDEEG